MQERTEAMAEHWASLQSRGQAEGKAAIGQLHFLIAISGRAHNTLRVTNTRARLLPRGNSSTAQTRTRARVERGKWYRKQVTSLRVGACV